MLRFILVINSKGKTVCKVSRESQHSYFKLGNETTSSQRLHVQKYIAQALFVHILAAVPFNNFAHMGGY